MTATELIFLVLVLGIAAAAAAVALIAVRAAARTLPAHPDRRAVAGRLLPLVQIAIGATALAVAAALLLDGHPLLRILAPLAILALLFWAGRAALRDLVTGAILQAEDPFLPGQRISAGAFHGRIRSVGLRSLEVQTDDGARLRLPYSGLATTPVLRRGPAAGPASHTFQLRAPAGMPPAAAVARLRRAILNSFHASAGRPPQVRLTHDAAHTTLEVTVYSPDPTALPLLETAARNALASP
jgi:small-conductance mechanosensitive channel